MCNRRILVPPLVIKRPDDSQEYSQRHDLSVPSGRSGPELKPCCNKIETAKFWIIKEEGLCAFVCTVVLCCHVSSVWERGLNAL